MNKKNILRILLTICLVVISSCIKKTYYVDNQTTEDVIGINGTKWTEIESSFFSNYRVMGMNISGDNLLISYLSSSGISGLYNGTTFSKISQNLGSGIGFEKIELINNKIYGVGLMGSSAVYKYDPTSSSNPWTSVLSIGTNAYSFEEYNGIKCVGSGISPYIRSNMTGSNYTTMGNGLNSYVNDLIIFNGKLIAAGSFNNSGSTNVSNIAQWDGNSWSPLASGLNSAVYDLVIYNNKLIALGRFGYSGSIKCPGVAVWDGTSWSTLGTGVSGGLACAYKAYVYGSELFIGGDFNNGKLANGSNISSPNIIKWDGSTWVALPDEIQDPIGEICVYKNKLYIANAFNNNSNNFLKRLD